MAKTIYVLNGPNLNLLGTREPQIYGRSTLKDVEKLCRKTADAHGFAIEFRQSNHEGVIVDWIQEAGAKKAVGIVLNPARPHPHLGRRARRDQGASSVPVIETPHHQHPRARALAPPFLHLVCRQGRDLRLRHPGLRAGDRRPRRDDRQKSKR